MSTLQAPHDRPLSETDRARRRSDLDHDLIAIVAMLAILVLTGLCFVAQSHLPF